MHQGETRGKIKATLQHKTGRNSLADASRGAFFAYVSVCVCLSV